MGGRPGPVQFFRLGPGALTRGAGRTLPGAMGCVGVTEEALTVEVMRASEASHCGAQYLMGLPWRLYRVAVAEAAKMNEERRSNGT